ncbi:hypothetical protein HYH03_006063 [Edaphochlamys debaryana]|uniref:TAP42-like protein n=1 Tax=Edaphochlamys debaryana TaxID=47281 RepID=A0A835Y623_9CHLO|nr:hypothetical protein HYH03_006063 [Edaphochlamys debaryana]|eukprot:KAG2495824.1 hypothetical protein HYH03_006063 [Edaphochlamys debaryana]
MHQDALVTSKEPDLIDAALDLLARTQSAVEAAGIFSANEDRDDLATADVKYLLVPFYRGGLLSAAPVRTDSAVGLSTARLAAVNLALPALGAFLHRCEQYDMLGALGRSAMDAAASGGAMDPAAKRTFKVDKFKREKALNAALGALEARRAAAAAAEQECEAGTSGAPSNGNGGAAAGQPGGGSLDEEDERQLWVWRVELAALQAIDMQTSLNQETELLQHAASREAAAAAAGPGPGGSGQRPPGQAAAGQPSDAERLALMERLRGVFRDLDGSKKEQIKRDVFKPGHIMPTMTVEEAGEIEGREAMEREARQRKQEDKERARRAALDSDEEDAEDKLKQRATDDWRDSHPKGYGNSKLRPCG